jgi:hypothetical protein
MDRPRSLPPRPLPTTGANGATGATGATGAMETSAPGYASLVVRPSRLQRLRAPLLAAGLVGGLTSVLSLRDPNVPGSWGGCPWLALTGHYCPGCGALRAVNDLTHLDVAGAASSNLLLVLAAPVLVVTWLLWSRRAWRGLAIRAPEVGPRSASRRGQTMFWPTTVLVGLAVAATVAFTVLRNLPAGSWLAP